MGLIAVLSRRQADGEERARPKVQRSVVSFGPRDQVGLMVPIMDRGSGYDDVVAVDRWVRAPDVVVADDTVVGFGEPLSDARGDLAV
jgi:hypothetical protein